MRTTFHAAALLLATALATSLAAPAALAQGYPNYQPPPPTPPTINFEWTGNAKRFTPSSVAGCSLELQRVFLRSGSIFAILRYTGTGARNVNLEARLAGGNNSKTGGGYGRVNAGQTSEIQLMTPYGGSLTGSTIAVRVTGCATV